jgi:flavin reductase (DIM6/NTAB) family NADH-FMN oxidoreductase RutF
VSDEAGATERFEAEVTAPVEFDLRLPAISVLPSAIGETFLDDVPEEEQIEIAGEPGQDPAIAFRRTLGMFATGVTVITTQVGDQVHGMTANAFMSVSLEPPLVVISVDRRAKMHQLLYEGRRYGINVLADDQQALSDRFAGRTTEGSEEPAFVQVHETPVVEGALAHLVARVVRSYWGGDHSLFLGRVEYARYGIGRPLLFHGGRYERMVGTTPVFSALPVELLGPIVDAGKERSYDDDETIVRTGDPGDELFVVLEGEVRVLRDGREITRIDTGSFFGEVSVLDGGARSADVVAAGPVRCLAIPRDVIRDALAASPSAAWAMLELLANRLRRDVES